jgi:hypothetical protein
VIIYDGKGVAVSGGDIRATYQGFVTRMKADPDIPYLVTNAGNAAQLSFQATVDYLYPEPAEGGN